MIASRTSKVSLGIIVVGCVLLASVVFVSYAPALKSGFRFVDDYTYLHWAGSMPLPQYLDFTWNPWSQVFNFRPLRRMLVLVEYNLFHAEPSYYHFVQILIHLANVLLVLEVTWRFSKRWRLAFLAALFFAVFPIVSEAVFWITDESALAVFFSLVSILFWTNYLQHRGRWNFSFATGALILALLSKESSVVLPVVLFLLDRMLVRDHVDALGIVRRYSLIAVVTVIYLFVEYIIQRQGIFFVVGAYSFGPHVLANYGAYLTLSVFPWGAPLPNIDVVLLVSTLGLFLVALLKRNWVLVFLLICFFLGIGPVVLSPQGAYGRYLYLATVPLAIFWSLVFESALRRWNFRWTSVIASSVMLCFLWLGTTSIVNSITQLSEADRQQRVPFSDIMRQHPTFPPNTRLFLIAPPFNLATPELAGLFFLRYGPSISLGSTYDDGRVYTGGILRSEQAKLRDYSQAYVYYFDESKHPIQVRVDKDANTQASLELPCDFQVPIRLEGYEVTSSTLKPNEPMAIILYWRATGHIDKDYTVFVHLINAKGEIVAGDDGYPRNGQEKTSSWRIDQMTADGHVLLPPPDVAVGEGYRLEVGLYYLPTLERVSITDRRGNDVVDTVVIEPFNIVE